ncbi:uncharacterized protein LOC120286510 isoform X1 [Eucalyptus grandis]|uniref:uncharacterized protein LOC120286510 isoform X1 n=1 Tax=Eucalyptus grandis TaxID=71139 RepID=UPI00192E7830|nr:uncharacterized protein LOC120286510 isoform X1 [Eucalyptus grandis]
MGCFLACFGSSKDGKRRKQRRKVQPRDHHRVSLSPPSCGSGLLRNSGGRPVEFAVSSGQEIPAKPVRPVEFAVSSGQEIPAKPVASVSDLLDKPEEPLSCSTRKKVTFDSNVKTYEHVLPPDDDGDAGKENLWESRDVVELDDNYEKLSQAQCASEDSSVVSSVRSHPPNHRYQNCRDSDDEDGVLDCNVSDLTDDDYDDDRDSEDEGQDSNEIYEGDDEIEETRAVHPTPSEVCNPEHMRRESPLAEVNPTKLNVNARDRSVYIHSVLNPVENLTQWKAVKAKGTPLPKHRKENLSFDQEARMSFDTAPALKEVSFSFKAKPNETKKSTQEVPVDASLSNWLPSSVTTPIEKKSATTLDSVQVETSLVKGYMSSPRSQEDRPILGALTVEELRQFSAKSSPRKSPSRSPDEMPIIGTVGTYWSQSDSVGNTCSTASSFKGIPNTTSKYREDKKVNWHSTPFETRLERALNRGAHQL